VDKELKGTILALATALVSGISVVSNKYFIVDIDTKVFTAIRSIAIGFAFVLMILFSKKKIVVKKLDWKALAVIGIIGGGLAFMLFFSGLKLTTAGRAGFLHKTLPLYVTLLAVIFLKEKVSRGQLKALLVMLGGLFIMSLSSLTLSLALGDLLVIAATVLWAVENVIAKKSIKAGSSSLIVSASRMLIGGLFLLAALMLLGDLNALLSLSATQMRNIIISTVLLFLYVLFYYWSLQYINVSKAASLLLLAPVITLIASMIFLSEQPPLLQYCGSALILAGSLFLIKAKGLEEHPI